MTATVTHLWRMLVWGRRLARHGALRPFESAKAPFAIRAVARIARIGTGAPSTPDFAAGLALGRPRGGQARPGARHPARSHRPRSHRRSRPPAGFAAAPALCRRWRPCSTPACRATTGGCISQSIDPVAIGAASMAQVHRGVTTDGRQVAIKMLRPGIEATLAEAIDTYQWAAGHIELLGGEFARLRPARRHRHLQGLDRGRTRPAPRSLERVGTRRSRAGRAGFRHPRHRLGAIVAPRAGHRLDRRHQDGRHGSAGGARFRPPQACRGARPRLSGAGDRQGLFPRRHAPGQSVRHPADG